MVNIWLMMMVIIWLMMVNDVPNHQPVIGIILPVKE
jgi:hypothetical protein